ncbi:MAG TPA: ankyrin repeat domain-containing protein [Planctomycetaceae bacterium]|jgi:ankyrin repeat protein|nr:ankyrin repeat domain-containing protein [Planctomycetaceae bacterium]
MEPGQKAINETLFEAAEAGDVVAIEQALTAGAQITSHAGQTRSTPLHCAARSAHIDAIKVLLKAGAEIDALDGDKDTALHWVAQQSTRFKGDYNGAAVALLEAGAKVDAGNKRKMTPLHYADKDVAESLLAAGANPIARDNEKRRPIDVARNMKDAKLADYLDSVATAETPRPTPNEVGLDMGKRNAALAALGKRPVVGPQTASLQTVDLQRQRSIEKNEGI